MTQCKFDQLCSVICSGSFEPVSNFTWEIHKRQERPSIVALRCSGFLDLCKLQ